MPGGVYDAPSFIIGSQNLFIYLDYPNSVVISCKKAVKYNFFRDHYVSCVTHVDYDLMNLRNIAVLRQKPKEVTCTCHIELQDSLF